MNGNCHFVHGATVGTMLAVNLGAVSSVLPHVTNTPETATLLVMGGIIGGIFPDIDNPTSYMGRMSAPVSTVIGKINELLGKKGSNHRGILHDPIVYTIALIISYFFFAPLIGFCIGGLCHLFLDLFNPNGIPIGPFKRVNIAKIKSGSGESVILTWVIIALTIIVGCSLKYMV